MVVGVDSTHRWIEVLSDRAALRRALPELRGVACVCVCVLLLLLWLLRAMWALWAVRLGAVRVVDGVRLREAFPCPLAALAALAALVVWVALARELVSASRIAALSMLVSRPNTRPLVGVGRMGDLAPDSDPAVDGPEAAAPKEEEEEEPKAEREAEAAAAVARAEKVGCLLACVTVLMAERRPMGARFAVGTADTAAEAWAEKEAKEEETAAAAVLLPVVLAEAVVVAAEEDEERDLRRPRPTAARAL